MLIATAARKAGLVDVSPHVFRHSGAVWMIEGGISLPEVSQYLGHGDLKTTEKIYARFSLEYLRSAAKVLDLNCMQVNQRTLSK